jgi:hypothetical protein
MESELASCMHLPRCSLSRLSFKSSHGGKKVGKLGTESWKVETWCATRLAHKLIARYYPTTLSLLRSAFSLGSERMKRLRPVFCTRREPVSLRTSFQIPFREIEMIFLWIMGRPRAGMAGILHATQMCCEEA